MRNSAFKPERTAAFFAFLFIFPLFLFSLTVSARQPARLSQSKPDTLIVDDAPEMNVIAFGKDVVIREHAKEVFVWGGDVVVEGKVDGDVAVLGGSVEQRQSGWIGGSVIVIGGTYRPASDRPARAENAETVVIGMFEDEFRNMGQDPAQIFAPTFTVSFLIQRALSALFWFVITILFATLAPGAVSRSIARFKLNALRTVAFGAAMLIVATIGVIGVLKVLPDYLGAVISLMAFLLLLLAYGFGRIVLQVSFGKSIQKYLLPDMQRAESASVLFGVLVWTIILSLPYVWVLAVFSLFAAGLGLILSVRKKVDWKAA